MNRQLNDYLVSISSYWYGDIYIVKWYELMFLGMCVTPASHTILLTYGKGIDAVLFPTKQNSKHFYVLVNMNIGMSLRSNDEQHLSAMQCT